MIITDLLVHHEYVFNALIYPNKSSNLNTLELARKDGVKLWLYAGSLSTIHAALINSTPPHKFNNSQNKKLLSDFTIGFQWLAALSGDIDPTMTAEDPLEDQLLHAIKRLGKNARILVDEISKNCQDIYITNDIWLENRTQFTIPFIDLATQQDKLRPQIEERIHRVLHHGHYIMGPEIQELELRLADYTNTRHCISVASGTDSLEIALRALGVGVNDEVITVPFTWISTAEVISAVGAKPVFIDVELDSFNLDPNKLSAAINSRTKAIIPVNLFGQMANYELISKIAGIFGIPVIEDAAQSFGATRNGNPSCGMTIIGSTSFFPAKPLGCYGDGGALFSNDDELASKMRAIRSHGGEKRHHHPYVGMNGRLDTLQAAIVLAKLDNWEWEVKERERIGKRYSDLIGDICITPKIMEGNTHVYAQYTVRVPDRDKTMNFLKVAGIPSAIYYPKCLHEQPVFKNLGYSMGCFPNAERASREVLSLPMHPYLSEKDQDKIVMVLKQSI